MSATRRFRVAVTVVVDVDAADEWDAGPAGMVAAREALAGRCGFVESRTDVTARDNGRADFSALLEDPYPEVPVKSWRDDWRRR